MGQLSAILSDISLSTHSCDVSWMVSCTVQWFGVVQGHGSVRNTRGRLLNDSLEQRQSGQKIMQLQVSVWKDPEMVDLGISWLCDDGLAWLSNLVTQIVTPFSDTSFLTLRYPHIAFLQQVQDQHWLFAWTTWAVKATCKLWLATHDWWLVPNSANYQC